MIARQVAGLCGIHRGFQACGVEVRRADDAHLSGIDELAEGLEDSLLRHRVVILMRVIEIDAIRAETLERCFGRCRDTRRLELFATFTRQHADLGRDQYVIAPAASPQPVADHRFGFATLMAVYP